MSKSRVVLCNQQKDVETSLDEDVEPTVQDEPCKKKLVITMTLRNAQVAHLSMITILSRPGSVLSSLNILIGRNRIFVCQY